MDTWDFEPEDCGRAPGSPPPPPAPPPTPPPVPPPPPPPATDGGVTMPPTDGGSVPAPMCIATAPTTGYCRTPGSCNLQAPTVTACDTSMAYDFYGAEYCNARATVIVVGAGWCGACQEEAPVVESTVTQPYRSRGVRVVTLLVENSDRSPATSAFCQRWQSRFGLTSRMVVDPSDTIGRRLSISGYPFIAVIDRRGRIRMAQSAPRMSQVTSLLNTIIAEP
jgi:thiol-disulfide isomerase/thioredoxin